MKNNKIQPLLIDLELNIPNIEYREFSLDNGLNAVLVKDTRIPTVVLNTTYHVGAKDEDDDKTGLAHLFEHLLFEGTANTREGEFDRILTQRGGDSNAYTTWDITSYFMVVPSNEIKLAMWLDSDRMAGFGIDERSLRIQKDVVMEEKLTVYDNSPYGSLEEESQKRLFIKSNYRRPIIGDMAHLSRVTLSDVEAFWKKHYSPNNAVLSVVGDIDYERTEDLIRKYYCELKSSGKYERGTYQEMEITEEIREDIYDNVHLPGKFIFYKIPKVGTKSYYALRILNAILSDGESSKFYNELIYKDELVSDIDAQIYEMEDVGVFNISCYAYRGKSMDRVEERVEEILTDLREGRFTDVDITKVKNRIETSYNARRHSMIGLADKLCYVKTFFGTADLINTEINNYLSITKDDLVEAANKFLNSNQKLVLNYLPK